MTAARRLRVAAVAQGRASNKWPPIANGARDRCLGAHRRVVVHRHVVHRRRVARAAVVPVVHLGLIMWRHPSRKEMGKTRRGRERARKFWKRLRFAFALYERPRITELSRVDKQIICFTVLP